MHQPRDARVSLQSVATLLPLSILSPAASARPACIGVCAQQVPVVANVIAGGTAMIAGLTAVTADALCWHELKCKPMCVRVMSKTRKAIFLVKQRAGTAPSCLASAAGRCRCSLCATASGCRQVPQGCLVQIRRSALLGSTASVQKDLWPWWPPRYLPCVHKGYSSEGQIVNCVSCVLLHITMQHVCK